MGVLGSDVGEELAGDHPLDPALERPGIGQGFVGAAEFEDVGGRDLRIGARQCRIGAGSEEGEGRDHRPRTDPGDDSESGPVAGLRPAVEETGGEGSVLAAAGQDQPRIGRGTRAVDEILEGLGVVGWYPEKALQAVGPGIGRITGRERDPFG